MCNKTDLLAIIEDELRRHPNAVPEDLRKLIAQSVYGGDHLLADPVHFREGLAGEWDRISPGERGEDMIQPIDPEGRVARIHLAPCKALGISVDRLAALLLSQTPRNGSRADYLRRWEAVVRLASAGKLPFDPKSLSDLSRLEGLAHHSRSYGFAAYRVINDLADARISSTLRGFGVLR